LTATETQFGRCAHLVSVLQKMRMGESVLKIGDACGA
jgi:hypothetical protein